MALIAIMMIIMVTKNLWQRNDVRKPVKPLNDALLLLGETAKVTGDVALSLEKAWKVPMLVDSGAGVNVVRTSLLRKGWEQHIKYVPVVRVRIANGNALQTRGEISLWIRIGSHLAKDRFVVRDNLPLPLLSGMGYQRQNVRHLSTIEDTIQMANGCTLPLLTR